MSRRCVVVTAAVLTWGAVAGAASAAPRIVDVRATAAQEIAAIAENGPPVVVPRRMPVDVSGRIVATLGVHSAHRYEIVLGRPGCAGANACTVATFTGDRGRTPSGAQRVLLARGVPGWFTPMSCGASCTRPVVAFRLRGVTYTFSVAPIGPTHRAQLVRLANQAIAGTAPAPRPANTPTPKQKAVCSASGDVCTGIYLRGTSIVIRRGYAAHYMTKDRLCLRYPGTQVKCRTVTLRRSSGATWRAQAVFPMQDPGPYQVVGVKGARIVAGI